MTTVILVLAILALVLGIIEAIRSRGQELLAWAVICLAAIHLVGRL